MPTTIQHDNVIHNSHDNSSAALPAPSGEQAARRRHTASPPRQARGCARVRRGGIYIYIYIYTHIHIHIYIYIYMYMCTYIYIYIYKERERERDIVDICEHIGIHICTNIYIYI